MKYTAKEFSDYYKLCDKIESKFAEFTDEDMRVALIKCYLDEMSKKNVGLSVIDRALAKYC